MLQLNRIGKVFYINTPSSKTTAITMTDRFVRGLLVVGGERGVITFKSASIAVTGTDQHHI